MPLLDHHSQWSVMSRPIGGVLFPGSLRRSGSVTIHLCGLPGISGRAARSLLGLAPGGVYQPPGRPGRWCALTAPFHPCLCVRRTERHRRSVFCGTFLRVAPTDSRQHPALWSPDLPRRVAAPRSPSRLTTGDEYARVLRRAHSESDSDQRLRMGPPGLTTRALATCSAFGMTVISMGS